MVSRRPSVAGADDGFTLSIYVGIPAEDFYGFIKDLNIAAAACVILSVLLMFAFVFKSSKLHSLQDPRAWKKVAGPIGCVLALSAIQLVIW